MNFCPIVATGSAFSDEDFTAAPRALQVVHRPGLVLYCSLPEVRLGYPASEDRVVVEYVSSSGHARREESLPGRETGRLLPIYKEVTPLGLLHTCFVGDCTPPTPATPAV